MTTIVQQLDHPLAGTAPAPARPAPRRFDTTRATAGMLLAAIVAALVVVATQLVDTWTEGHLLAAWVMVWTVAFAAAGLALTPARQGARALRTRAAAWNARRRQAVADAKLWETALYDPRVMADIRCALARAEGLAN